MRPQKRIGRDERAGADSADDVELRSLAAGRPAVQHAGRKCAIAAAAREGQHIVFPRRGIGLAGMRRLQVRQRCRQHVTVMRVVRRARGAEIDRRIRREQADGHARAAAIDASCANCRADQHDQDPVPPCGAAK